MCGEKKYGRGEAYDEGELGGETEEIGDFKGKKGENRRKRCGVVEVLRGEKRKREGNR